MTPKRKYKMLNKVEFALLPDEAEVEISFYKNQWHKAPVWGTRTNNHKRTRILVKDFYKVKCLLRDLL